MIAIESVKRLSRPLWRAALTVELDTEDAEMIYRKRTQLFMDYEVYALKIGSVNLLPIKMQYMTAISLGSATEIKEKP